jgi:hypothetical protein
VTAYVGALVVWIKFSLPVVTCMVTLTFETNLQVSSTTDKGALTFVSNSVVFVAVITFLHLNSDDN